VFIVIYPPLVAVSNDIVAPGALPNSAFICDIDIDEPGAGNGITIYFL
jgi:hypothetical protein